MAQNWMEARIQIIQKVEQEKQEYLLYGVLKERQLLSQLPLQILQLLLVLPTSVYQMVKYPLHCVDRFLCYLDC